MSLQRFANIQLLQETVCLVDYAIAIMMMVGSTPTSREQDLMLSTVALFVGPQFAEEVWKIILAYEDTGVGKK